jgi:predicted AAA+ superfamily ATPase
VKTLRSYASTYLKEEIQAEALTRNLEGFSRFLFIAAQWSGRFLDFIKLASESRINRQSAIRYFEILEETLVVSRCSAFSKNPRQRLIQHPKFYFFDSGVWNALLNNFTASADRIGPLFEHFFFNQLVAAAAASPFPAPAACRHSANTSATMAPAPSPRAAARMP